MRSSTECSMRRGSRWSVKPAANWRMTPVSCSTWRRRRAPPSEAIYQRRTSSSRQRRIYSVCISAEALSSRGTDYPPGVREEALVGMVNRRRTFRSSGRGRRQLLVLEDVELLGHQAVQFREVAVQVIQHLGHRILHRLERLMPPVQRLLPQELPQPLDQVEVGRVGRQEHQVELPMARQPLLHHRLAVVPRIVQVQDELLGGGVLGQQRLQEL